MSNVALQEESRFFREHVAEWSNDKERYEKWALVKGRKLIGAFDGFNEAVAKGFELFGLELFFVSEIHPDANRPLSIPTSFSEFANNGR